MKKGDAVVMISDPLNQVKSIRDTIRGKGGVVIGIRSVEDLLIVFEGKMPLTIWKERVRMATPEEARIIKLIHNLRR